MSHICKLYWIIRWGPYWTHTPKNIIQRDPQCWLTWRCLHAASPELG